jgi:hypothetical protein
MTTPRALTIHRTLVPPADRAKYVERLKVKEAHFTGSGCRYWVFEEQMIPGAFVEFVEAADIKTLTAAHAAAPDKLLDAARVYTSVELT